MTYHPVVPLPLTEVSIVISSFLVLTCAIGVLRVGPMPPVMVAPDQQTAVYLQRYVINTADDPRLDVDVVRQDKLPACADSVLRAVTVGPIADRALPGNLGAVEIALKNQDGDQATAIVPVIVAQSASPQVTLKYRAASGVRKVVAAGEFNNWSQTATPLTDPDGDGEFTATFEASPGRYTYKLVVDGQWMADPGNPNRTPDGFGGENTVLTVAGPPSPPRLIGREISGDRAVIEFVPGESGRGIANVLAIGNGQRLRVERTGNLMTVTLPAVLPADGDAGAASQTGDLPRTGVATPTEDAYVQVLAADDAGGVSRPFAFYAEHRAGRLTGQPAEQPTGSRNFRWEDGVLYFAFIDRFANGDGDNDAPLTDSGLLPQANYFGGDLAGLRQKIEGGYFTKLGVNAIWLSPFLRNPDRAYQDALPPHRLFSGYHGYWPISDTEVDPRFGTNAELKTLVDAAHAHGIKVLFDMVYNHVHEDNPVARQHPDWIVPLNLPDGRQNIRLFDEFPLTTWFDNFLPDIDYGVRAAAEYEVARTLEFVRQTGVDGFRLDAVKHVPHPFWMMLRHGLAQIEAERGEHFYLVGESIDSRRKINEFVGTSMLDGQFDFPMYWAIRGAFAEENDGYDRIEAELTKGENEYTDDAIHSELLGNHDVSRFMAYAEHAFAGGVDEKELGWTAPPEVKDPANYEKLKMAFTFLFAIRGVPLIYYGDEIGMTGAHDPDNRRPMEWGDQVNADQHAVFDHVARLTVIRRDHPALRYGVRRPLLAERDRLAFLREHFGDVVVACWNRGASATRMGLSVGPDVADGITLTDALGSGVRGTVTGGKLSVEIPAHRSVMLVRE